MPFDIAGLPARPHNHEVRFYSDDAVFVETVSTFVTAALMAGKADHIERDGVVGKPQSVTEAVHEALNELAAHLGGSSDTGGPVENATQIKGREDLGVLLTDADDRVLGLLVEERHVVA